MYNVKTVTNKQTKTGVGTPLLITKKKKIIKGPFRDPQPHPQFSTKKVEIFTSVEAFRYIIYVCKIFLANSFVWLNNRRIGYLLCRHEKYTT